MTTTAAQEHEELIQRLGTVLLDNAPQEQWRRIDLVAGADLVLTTVMADGTKPRPDPPADLPDVVAELRTACGPWLSARFTIDPPVAINYNYNFEHGPGTTASGPLSPEQARELVKGFSTWMIHVLPAEWDQLFLTARATDGAVDAGAAVDVSAQLRTVLDETVDWTPPEGVTEFFQGLKDAMSRPWTSVAYHLVHPGRFNAEYDWAD